MRAKVTTQIDGQTISVTGTLNAKRTQVKDSKGMILTICKNDTIEILAVRSRAPQIACPFDMHKFFKMSKQI